MENNKKLIAVLALQGAFAEHQTMLDRIGADSMLIRNLNDWNVFQERNGSALIIPGGESTAMTRIIKDEQLFEPIRQAIAGGLPVFGTCAGLIMLDGEHLGTMDITVRRNAYGRQLGSFFTEGLMHGIADDGDEPLPMTFIRAPYIESAGEGVKILAQHDGHIIAAQQGNQLVTSFHPELNDDLRIHKYFLSLIG